MFILLKISEFKSKHLKNHKIFQASFFRTVKNSNLKKLKKQNFPSSKFRIVIKLKYRFGDVEIIPI
jgi:hypothetical protein